ncbi:hypothetical protein Gotri_027496, partial [Gossypium trilobum]|nr:hypothetical protein [Gossypium trilobum]
MACVDVILDCVGAAYLQRNLVYLNVDGRLFIIGSITEFVAELNTAAMFEKRFSIQGINHVINNCRPNPLLRFMMDAREKKYKALLNDCMVNGTS